MKIGPNYVSRVNVVSSFVFKRGTHSCEMHPSHIAFVWTLVMKYIVEDVICMLIFVFLVLRTYVELPWTVKEETKAKTCIAKLSVTINITYLYMWIAIVKCSTYFISVHTA